MLHTITSPLLWHQLWTLQPWNPTVKCRGTVLVHWEKKRLDKSAQLWPNQPDWISTWACRNHHPDDSPNQNFTIRMHACSMVEGITSTAVTKVVFRWPMQLEPKWQFWSAAILVCIIGKYKNHALILGTKLVFTEVPSNTFTFKRNMPSDVIKSGNPSQSVLPSGKWTAGKRRRTSAMPNLGVSHGITSSHVVCVLSTFEANLEVTDIRKKHTLYACTVNLTLNNQRFEWW